MGFISIWGVYHRSTGLNSISFPCTIDDEMIYLATVPSSNCRRDYLHFLSSVFYIVATNSFVHHFSGWGGGYDVIVHSSWIGYFFVHAAHFAMQCVLELDGDFKIPVSFFELFFRTSFL